MTQILGTGSGKTSSAANEPVVERGSAQVFFTSAALAASVRGSYVGATTTTLGNTLISRVGAATGIGAISLGRVAPQPFTVFLFTMFYSKGLNEGEDEMLRNIRGDQLYQNLIQGQMMVGAFMRLDSTVADGNYIPEYQLREIAEQNGRVRTRVRFRFAEDPQTGKLKTYSYQVGEGSGLDRVRVRFAKQLDPDTWSFEDPSVKGRFIWSRARGEGRFEQGTQQTTIHDGNTGGYTSPPTPVPEPQGLWGLPNPAPEPLPPLPGTPVPDEQRPNIETLPIEDRDFDDFIIIDPIGDIPAIYVYFQKPPVEDLEVDYFDNFKGRSRLGLYEVDHIPSKEAVKIYLKNQDPLLGDAEINRMINKVAAVAIPKEIHRKCSETYGGRNNSNVETENGEIIKRKDFDASTLEDAVNTNWDANAECLKREYNISTEKVEEIRAKLHELNRQIGLY
ncbi:S-type pyocin [Enterobacter sp. BIGb0383]|uniref:S-type pyocin domain-containing protein n=1 Tax=unclassified Enterobacter TaxID=2608935 RepID=UPI000F49694A|nr:MULTISPECIES: S-type pyocin domain-containing protein [unclassified Enterobacter]ROP61785.1 S-type pyocin [Enterobacter sp. BIGb0383]ROS11946.1 S-type pyocin [Enterobacter sp. BIGb0359]